MAAPVTFDELQRGKGVVYGVCDGIWVMTLFGTPTKDSMLLARPTLTTMKERHPSGFCTLTWILPEAGYRMDADARQAAADVTRPFNPCFAGQATLIEGSGFGGAAVRAIISTLDVMAGGTYPKKVFSDLASSVEWCGSLRSAGSRNPASTTQSVATLRALRESLRSA